MIFQCLQGGELQENCYVLTDEKTGAKAVIDPGFWDDRLEVVAKSGKVAYILLTHGHFDHTAGVEKLREKTGAPVLALGLEEPLLTDGRLNVSLAFSGRAYACAPDRLLTDGETFPLGGTKITVLSTPGHTAGSCCYITEEAVFTGDTLMGFSVGRTDLPTGDSRALAGSLKKLLALPGDPAVCGGHGPVTTLEAEREKNPYLRFLL